MGDVTVSIAIFLKTSIDLLDNISTDLLVVGSDFYRPPYWRNMGFSYRVPQSSYTADNFTLNVVNVFTLATPTCTKRSFLMF